MKSGYSIEWTSEAERNLSAIFDYLEENWTQREISNFAERLETNLKYISEHPAAFPILQQRKKCKTLCNIFTNDNLLFRSSI